MLGLIAPWYGIDSGVPFSPTLGTVSYPGSNGFSDWGFGYFGFWLVAAALLAMRAIPIRFIRSVVLPVPDWFIYGSAGALMIVSALLYGYAYISGPFNAPYSMVHLQAGWWLALVAPVVILLGAWWKQ